jgi:hypothetical protein
MVAHPEREILRGRTRRNWAYNILIDNKGREEENVDWTNLVSDRPV